MKIIECGPDSWMLGELVKQLMDDAKAVGVYCNEAYIGQTVDRLRACESHTKGTESTAAGLREASWMRSSGDLMVFADYSAEANTLTFSRVPF